MKIKRLIAAAITLVLVLTALPGLAAQAAPEVSGTFRSSSGYLTFHFQDGGTVGIESDDDMGHVDSWTGSYEINGDHLYVYSDFEEEPFDFIIEDEDILFPNPDKSDIMFSVGGYVFKMAPEAELSNVHYDAESGLTFNYPSTMELLPDGLTADDYDAGAVKFGNKHHLMFFDYDSQYHEMSAQGFTDFEILRIFTDWFFEDNFTGIFGELGDPVGTYLYDIDNVFNDMYAQYDENEEIIAYSRGDIVVSGGGVDYIVYSELTNAGGGKVAFTVMVHPRYNYGYVSVMDSIMLSLRYAPDGNYSAEYSPRVTGRVAYPEEEPEVYGITLLSAEHTDGKLRFLFDYDEPQGHLTIEIFNSASAYLFGYETQGTLNTPDENVSINWSYVCNDGTTAENGDYMVRYWTEVSDPVDEYFTIER